MSETSDEIKKKWDDRIAFLREHREYLSEWENEFTVSLESQRYYGKILSPKQVGVLYDIYHKIDWRLG
jgi:hypothetical protein